MELIHLHGVYFINYLQNTFQQKWQEEFFLICSHIGDPKNAFVFYFPLVFAWRKCDGRKLLVAAVMSEWLNLTLKWYLRGERPYWWVHEANSSGLTLKQFYLTCETGPGSPSGHVMVTCAVGVFIVLALTFQPSSLGQLMRRTTWFVYSTIVFLVSLSRIYIAAHFPHQIIFAIFLGNVIGCLIWKDATNRPPRLYAVCSPCLILGSLLLYHFLSLFFDPAYSIPKAMEWCANKEFIKLDTTPFYAVMRDSGAILGIGVSEFLVKGSGATKGSGGSVVNKVIQAILSIAFVMCLEHIPLTLHVPVLFYLLGFLKNLVLVVVVMTVVPPIVHRLFCVKSSVQSSVIFTKQS